MANGNGKLKLFKSMVAARKKQQQKNGKGNHSAASGKLAEHVRKMSKHGKSYEEIPDPFDKNPIKKRKP